MSGLVYNIWRKWMKLRFQPIRVYCLHHICAQFDEKSMNRCDWTNIKGFKRQVLAMRNNGVRFISLSDAHAKITNDKYRIRKYAVLTIDDGYASLKEILPWLEGQLIPVTLFINGKYLDGKSYRKNPKERYITKKELDAITNPLIEIANHGWEHIRVTDMTPEDFKVSVQRSVELLSSHPNYVQFWAYAYGTGTQSTAEYLRSMQIVPVYINNGANYNNPAYINREFLKME